MLKVSILERLFIPIRKWKLTGNCSVINQWAAMSSLKNPGGKASKALKAGEVEVESKLKSGRKPRRAIKIEQKDDEEEVTSKYFKNTASSASAPVSDSTKPEGRSRRKKHAGHQVEEETSPFFDPSKTSSTAEDKTPNEAQDGESPMKKKRSEAVKVEPPANWKTLLENIQTMRSSKTAAVDTMGCERTADLNESPQVQRFHTLVSLILSSQTKDQVTYAAMERLKSRRLTVQTMLDIDETELAEILKPVGFYKRKATYIKKTAETLREKYEDDIPQTVEDLCALTGVGPKMAYICMNAAWKVNAGIGVDTHVHRIANRLKWTGMKGTSTPEKTREALESWLPKDIWQEVNVLLVGFGQEMCLPIGPKCSDCLNKDICPSSNVRDNKKKKK